MAKRTKKPTAAQRIVFSALLCIVLIAGFFYYAGLDPLEAETGQAVTAQSASPAPSQTATPTPTASPQPTPSPEASARSLLPRKGQLTVAMIDVGQGDSIFIQSPAGKTMLVDAGEEEAFAAVDLYLKAAGIRKIDVLIGTHPHSDHIGAMAQIVQAYQIGAIYLPKASHDSPQYEALLSAVKEKGLKVKTAKGGENVFLPLDDAIDVRVLAPLSKEYDNLNNYSVVLRIAYKSRAILLTGDAETLSENEILKAFPRDLLQSDVLKVGHHGSDTSTSPKFLAAVSPSYALISAGEGNSYDHPKSKVVSRLEQAGASIYRTDRNGTVVLFTDGRKLDLLSERE